MKPYTGIIWIWGWRIELEVVGNVDWNWIESGACRGPSLSSIRHFGFGLALGWVCESLKVFMSYAHANPSTGNPCNAALRHYNSCWTRRKTKSCNISVYIYIWTNVSIYTHIHIHAYIYLVGGFTFGIEGESRMIYLYNAFEICCILIYLHTHKI